MDHSWLQHQWDSCQKYVQKVGRSSYFPLQGEQHCDHTCNLNEIYSTVQKYSNYKSLSLSLSATMNMSNVNEGYFYSAGIPHFIQSRSSYRSTIGVKIDWWSLRAAAHHIKLTCRNISGTNSTEKWALGVRTCENRYCRPCRVGKCKKV